MGERTVTMTTVTDLKTLTAKVHHILTEDPECRDSDKRLIMAVLAEHYGVRATDGIKEILERDDLPNFESIRRCRQKIQEEDESLRGTRRVEAGRLEQQEAYIAYARGEIDD